MAICMDWPRVTATQIAPTSLASFLHRSPRWCWMSRECSVLC